MGTWFLKSAQIDSIVNFEGSGYWKGKIFSLFVLPHIKQTFSHHLMNAMLRNDNILNKDLISIKPAFHEALKQIAVAYKEGRNPTEEIRKAVAITEEIIEIFSKPKKKEVPNIIEKNFLNFIFPFIRKINKTEFNSSSSRLRIFEDTIKNNNEISEMWDFFKNECLNQKASSFLLHELGYNIASKFNQHRLEIR